VCVAVHVTDSQLVTTIRHLVCATDVPADITPTDRLQIIRFLIQGGDEKNLYVSQDTLAAQLGITVPSIVSSQKRLKEQQWLIIHSGGYHQRTNLYSVNLEKLPVADLHRTVVTDGARRLAAGYAKYLRKTAKKRLWRSWEQQASFICQKLIEQANNDLDLAKNVINFALCDPRYRRQALKGPRGLRRKWKQIVAEYQAQQAGR